MLKFANAVILLLLLGTAALFAYVYFGKPKAESRMLEGTLAKIIPAKVEGWASKDLPLGDTPEVERAARKILQASDYLSREYKSDDGSSAFGLYIAYWEKGKDGTANASSHTPDRCWVENGWKNHLDKKKSDYLFGDIDGIKIMPAYYRYMTFDRAGVKRNVLFWFIADGKRYDYGDGNTYVRNPIDYFKNMFISAFIGSPDLYFVRLDSETPFEELAKNPGFRKILKSLGKNILSEGAAMHPARQENLDSAAKANSN